MFLKKLYKILIFQNICWKEWYSDFIYKSIQAIITCDKKRNDYVWSTVILML